MRRTSIASLGVLLITSCTTLRTTTQLQPIDNHTERLVVEAAELQATSATDTEGNLVLTLTQADTCRERTVTTYDRTEVTQGTKGPAIVAAVVGGLFAVSAGVLGAVAASSPEEAPADDPEAITRSDALVGVGVSGGVAGVAFTWAAVEGIRGRKREKAAGQESKTGGWQDEACNQRPVANAPVDVLVGDVFLTSASTDATGHLVLSIDQVSVILARSDSGLTVKTSESETVVMLGDGVVAEVAAEKKKIAAAKADPLAEEAHAAIEAGELVTGKMKARECLGLVTNHPPCLEASRLAICQLAISETDMDVEARYESIDGLNDGGSEAVKTCLATAKKTLGPEYERAVGARDFIDDTQSTYDALWNYVLAKHLKGRSVDYQTEFEAERIIELIPRDVCPAWRQAIKDHGKEHLDAAISAYCTDGDFPHEIQNNVTGVTTTLTVEDCEKTVRKMCRW